MDIKMTGSFFHREVKIQSWVNQVWKMNLMEIGKKPEIRATGTIEELMNSEIITESLTQPSEGSPIMLNVERDILIQSFKKEKESMRTQKQQILEEEKQMILFDRQRLREEVRKSTDSASDNRTVRNAEVESIASAEQRRSEEQKWLNEQERARAARRRNKRCSGPEL